MAFKNSSEEIGYNKSCNCMKTEVLSLGCQIVRKIYEYISIVTVVAASGNIIALSFERYVACVHCLRFHVIVTDKLTNRILGCVWIVSLIMGLVDKERYVPNYTEFILPLHTTTNIIYAITVLSSSAILVFVQVRLYILSKKKRRINPHFGLYGRKAEANDMRRHNLKVNIIASAVVVLYVVCMCPLAIYMIGIILFPRDFTLKPRLRLMLCLFSLTNTFFNSFVYGFGLADTRQGIKKEIRAIKAYLSQVFGRCSFHSLEK
eukprot:gene10026-11050_t